jgi:hypothetical protein
MNNMVKFIIAMVALVVAVVGALVIIDKITNKNRLEDDYLDCDISDELLD